MTDFLLTGVVETVGPVTTISSGTGELVPDETVDGHPQNPSVEGFAGTST